MTRRALVMTFVMIATISKCLPAVSAEGSGKQNFGLITGSTGKTSESAVEESYCTNITDAAKEAQFAWRLKKIAELESELKKRIETLETKKAEIETWMAKRNAFLEMARKSLVEIYKKMRPDAAAQQVAALDDLTAAAIVMKLDARAASRILAEIDAKRAARLAQVISGAAHTQKIQSGDGQ